MYLDKQFINQVIVHQQKQLNVIIMGYLGAKDLGMLGVQTTNNLIEGIVDSSQGAVNPTDNNGITNLNAYALSFNTGKVINAEPNIAGNITRVAIRSSKPTSIELSVVISDRRSKNETDTISYLTAWSRNRTTIMLFYMPNTSSTTLSYGQEIDFYYSELKILYDTIWDKNLGTSAYGVSTYVSSRYYTGATVNSSDYNACALPCVFEDITVKKEATSHTIEISLKGYILENEEQ